jgi:N-acetylglucosaminyldiphosphoundecaprenol N-acetyl-beta-D-mannosaminyltransferase
LRGHLNRPAGAADPKGVPVRPRPPRKPAEVPDAAVRPPVPSRSVLGLRIDATSYAECTAALLELAEAGAGGMVCAAPVAMVMEAFDAPDFRQVVNAADRVTPDGMPLVWALRWLGLPRATRVYGPELTLAVCAAAEQRGVPVGFYGGRTEVLTALLEAIARRFPRLRIAFAASPPFRDLEPEEEREVLDAIRDSGTRLLFVGLGCPRQERWMAARRGALSCAMVGVGAAFDFIAGAKPQAPGWIQRAGLEWLFRLATEPRRLWRRYLTQNPRFVLHFARQLLRRPPS